MESEFTEQEVVLINEPEEEIPGSGEGTEKYELEGQEDEDSEEGDVIHGELELELKLSDGERERLERGRREKEGRTDATSEKTNEREEDPENVMRLEKPLAEFTTNVIDYYGKGWVQAKEGRWTRTEEVEVKQDRDDDFPLLRERSL